MAFPAVQEAVDGLFEEDSIDVSAAAFLTMAVETGLFREDRG